jgi:hypothetical protein
MRGGGITVENLWAKPRHGGGSCGRVRTDRRKGSIPHLARAGRVLARLARVECGEKGGMEWLSPRARGIRKLDWWSGKGSGAIIFWSVRSVSRNRGRCRCR